MKQMISHEELENVNGGIIVRGDDEKYYLVKADGTVIAPTPTIDKATEFARSLKLSEEVLTMEEYEHRFGRKFEWLPARD